MSGGTTAPLRTDRFERILVVCTRQIGDVLLTTPLIDAAKTRWPAAQIDVLGFTGTLAMLRGNPQIGALIEVPSGSGWRQSMALIRRLWRRYDLALIAQYSDRAHLYGAVAARRRSGQVPAQRYTSWWKRLLLEHAVEVGEERTHAVLEKLELLAPWAAPLREVRVRPPVAHELPDDIARRLHERFVVIHVPTLVRYKQWPIPHHIALVQGLLVDGFQVVLSGGPSAADRLRTAEVVRGVGAARRVGAEHEISAARRVSTEQTVDVAQGPGRIDDDQLLDTAGMLDLGQLVSLLRRAVLYIGPDTSITHLAAACETPLIALYGPVDPRIFGPWPQGHAPVQPYVKRASRQWPQQPPEPPQQPPAPAQRPDALGAASAPSPTIVLLQGDPACVPCNQAGCERHNESRSDCLETMAPERVLDEARALLGTAPVLSAPRSIPIHALRSQ
ncbi:MAG: glycosyltransferase family 9 protein [Pseudomonadota bacterium]|nr:glycosyltransferase family 9 protein [Pseudomonadota bacterium]